MEPVNGIDLARNSRCCSPCSQRWRRSALIPLSTPTTWHAANGPSEVVHVYQLPDWINDQAKKNKRKAFRFEFGSMTLIAITAWLGDAANSKA